MMSTYHSISSFAKQANVAEITVRRWVKSGRVPAFQPAGRHGRLLIPADALSACRVPAPDTVNDSQLKPPAADRTDPGQRPVDQRAIRGRVPKWKARLGVQS